jgi:hypothetical protein
LKAHRVGTGERPQGERTGQERKSAAMAMPMVVRPLPCWQLKTKQDWPRGAAASDAWIVEMSSRPGLLPSVMGTRLQRHEAIRAT